MNDTEAELRGRITMLETLLVAAITNVAATTPDAAGVIRRIMANTEDNLFRAGEAAPEGDQPAAKAAHDAFADISDAMQRHLAQRSHKPGRG